MEITGVSAWPAAALEKPGKNFEIFLPEGVRTVNDMGFASQRNLETFTHDHD
jgi:hypothetical protein